MSSPSAVIGVIGGTGVYRIDGLSDVVEVQVPTPFGNPSSPIIIGSIGSVRMAFLARHDTTHRLLPTEIPFKANIYALKSLGVKYILSFSACGSLKEEIAPQDVVLVNQYVDLTKHRASTFFGEGIIAHVALADPVCPVLTKFVHKAIVAAKDDQTSKLHLTGTYICIEGPCFSTKAESNIYRSWGASVIGMTGMPEAKLAREAEIAYCPVSLVTDYDCWHPDHDNVTVEMVLKTLKKNGDLAQRIIKELAAIFDQTALPESPAHSALKHSILTPIEHIGKETRERIGLIIGKYL
jgi:5'-methylthioadenosine phosphorylase